MTKQHTTPPRSSKSRKCPSAPRKLFKVYTQRTITKLDVEQCPTPEMNRDNRPETTYRCRR
jgi:hypothetical protein